MPYRHAFPLTQLPAWPEPYVRQLITEPDLVPADRAGVVFDDLLDNRQPLTPEAEPLRTALYEVLKARHLLKGSNRERALRRLEGCTCGRIDYAVDRHGTRRCGCGRTWRLRIEVRHTVFQVPVDPSDRSKGTVPVPVRLPVARGRHLVAVEI